MSQPGRYCPFLNRDDDRCAQHFRVGSLGQTFAECFGDYASCSTYKELLVERRVKRAEAQVVTLHVHGRSPSESVTHAA